MEQSKKHFLKNMVGFSLSTWITFAIGLIASPIATRLFTPAEYGQVNLFTLYTGLLASVCYLGLDQAFVRFFREPPQGGTAAGMLTFCTVTSLGFSLLISALLCGFWPGVSALVTGKPDVGVFLCLCAYSFCTVVFRYLNLCYRMEQNAKLYTLQGVVYAVLTKIAYLAVGFGSARGRAAILTLTALMAAFTLVCLWLQRRRFDPGFARQVKPPFVREMAGFAAPLIPLTVIVGVNTLVSPMVLSQLMGTASVGIYTSALALASTINLIQAGFNTYWAPYVYENYQSDNKRRFFTVHRLMACALTLFGLGVTLLQGPIYLLLGPGFRSSVIYFPFLFLTPICYCLSETTGLGIGIAKKTYWNTWVFLASVVVNLGLCFLLIPPLGEIGAALAAATAAVLSLLLRTWAGEKYYKAILNYRPIAYSIALMLLAAAGNWLLHGSPLAKYLLLAGLFVAACAFFRREVAQLWHTALQVLTEGKSALRRLGDAPAPGGEEEQP